MTFATHSPVHGSDIPESGFQLLSEFSPAPGVLEDVPHDSFRQLVSLHQSNEVLLRELSRVISGLDEARLYLASPGCNSALGQTYHLRLRARHSALLTFLRANKIQARDLLSRLNHEPKAD